MDVRRLARDERADFAAFLATLPTRQWDALTLCADWRVRDVVAHVIGYDELDALGVLRCAVRGRFWSSRVNAIVLERYGSCGPEQLLGLLRSHLEPRGLLAALGGRPALTEGVIHHQDVRRALGQPRVVPPERLLVALRWALLGPDIGGLWRVRGLRLIATDLPFSAGAGLEVRGAAEALLMAIAGRRDVTNELTGPGRARLDARISRT